MRRSSLWLLLLLLAAPALAKDDPTSLLPEVQAWFDAETPEARATIALRLALRGTSPEAVHAVLPKVRRFAHPDSQGGAAGRVVSWKRTTGADRQHTIFARVPQSYDATKSWPVLIWLHGGTRREEDGGGAFGAEALGERVDTNGFIVVSPSAHSGVDWFSPAGVALVRGALADAKARWHIDANRVFVTGFSDGASGCYHLLAHDPGPYAAFLPMMGHPAFTRMRGGPTYAADVQSRPVFAVNGAKDALYPSATVKPLIEGLKRAGCAITWKDLPEGTHSLTHMAEVWDELWAFARAHPRQTTGKEKHLTCFDPKRGGRLDWIEIVRVDPKAKGDPEHAPRELKLPRRVMLGVRLDPAFPGPGLRIASVEEASPAGEGGMLAGDVLRKVGDTVLGRRVMAIVALRQFLSVAGDTKTKRLTVTVERDGKETVLEITARIPAAGGLPRPAVLGYDVPAGRVAARRETRSKITIFTHQVGALRLHLSEALVDLGRPLEIYVNGRRRFQGAVKPDVAYALGEILRSGSARPHNVAVILVRP